MKDNIIIACDFSGKEETLEFLSRLDPYRPYLKIGMELFYACGGSIVTELKSRGHKIFLDLKLHDIPNTVMRTMSVLSRLGADMVNVHAAGSRAMMEAAVTGATRPDGTRPKIIAVTQLTSTSYEVMRDELLINVPIEDAVSSYAENAKRSGLDGVVCSPLEAGPIHRVCGDGFLTVTPGVRFDGGDTGDQHRVMTPRDAAEAGSDYIVIGRPITRAENVRAAYLRAEREFNENK